LQLPLTIQHAALVFVGGGVGSLLRYGVGRWLINQAENGFPLGTFVANSIGCFVIGLAIAGVAKVSGHPNWSVLIVTGFCGGFTTFSSFAYEQVLMLERSMYPLFWLYLMSSVGAGIGATLLGMYLVRSTFTPLS
jgi:CrcB protein